MTVRTTTKRYHVVSSAGVVLDVFSKKSNAIASAFKFALEYKNDIFYVVKKSLHTEVIVLEISINAKFKFVDAFDVLAGMEKATATQKKKVAGAYKKENWRP